MKTKFFTFILILVLSVSVVSAFIPANDKALEKGLAEKSKVIEASDSGWFLKHSYIIHYAKDKPAKPERPAKPTRDKCYKTFSKWSSTPVSYDISTFETDGLNPLFIEQTFTKSAETWDSATTTELFNDEYTVTDLDLPFGALDEYNALLFRDWVNDNVIAVTSIWYSRGRHGQIYDFDVLFNTFYNWGDATIDPTLMDLENIAVHELGHAVGMSDIYDWDCSAVTMFGYSWEGDVEKRTLEQSDITGLQSLY